MPVSMLVVATLAIEELKSTGLIFLWHNGSIVMNFQLYGCDHFKMLLML